MRPLQRLGLLGHLRSSTDLRQSYHPALSAWPLHGLLTTAASTHILKSYATLNADGLVPFSVLAVELDGSSPVSEGVRQYVQPSSPGHGLVLTSDSRFLISTATAMGGAVSRSYIDISSRRRSSSCNTSTRLYCSNSGSQTTSLADEQRAAAFDFSEQVVHVVAGPGSGKTKVLIARLKHLVEERHVRRDSIAVLTYSRKTAADLVGRIREAVPMSDTSEHDVMSVGTFHSLSNQLLQ